MHSSQMSLKDDMVLLQAQRRVILEQLRKTEHRMERMGGILQKKTLSRPELSDPAAHTRTLNGTTIADLRLTQRNTKAVPKVHVYDPYSLEAEPVSNHNILRIRQDHAVKTIGRDEIRRHVRAKTLEQERKEAKAKARERHVPDVKVPPSMLPNRYLRGELPCTIEHGSSGLYLSWACPLENLDYEYYLPLFFDGLQCKDHITAFLARQGIEDMLYASKGHPERITPIIHSLARPLRNALSKFDTEVLLAVLKALEQLILCNEGIGQVLLPYGRQFLVPMAYFMDMNKNLGDSIDYAQRRSNDVGEQVRRVLELMEEHGGPKALQFIKFSVPLYESCIKRPDAHHQRDAASAQPSHR